MLDFQAMRERKVTIDKFVEGVSISDLADLTDEMIDTMLAMLADCTDADVVFEPLDPKADDKYASDESERNVAWNLGHLVAHTTASSEESAFLAAELARGVENHGRSRSEVPWREMTTIQQCVDRLEESRRMRLASLEMWPEEPHLDIAYEAWPGGPRLNAIGRFVFGLSHDDSHLGQFKDVIQQAKEARAVSTD